MTQATKALFDNFKRIAAVTAEATEIAAGKKGQYPFDRAGKKRLLAGVTEYFAPLREKRAHFEANPALVDEIIQEGCSKARAAAIQRGMPVRLVFSGNTVLIRSEHPVTGVIDTVGEAADLASRYGVRVTASRDSLLFDPRGLRMRG